MKNKILKSTGLTMAICLIGSLYSCNKENEDLVITESTSKTKLTSKLSNYEQVNLSKIGFDLEKTEKKFLGFPDNTSKEYYVYEDISFPVEGLSSLDNLGTANPLTESEIADADAKLFRHPNLAAGNRTYTVAFFDINEEYARQAIGDMIWAFNNNLNTTVRLTAVFAASANFGTTENDIAVFFRQGLGTALARADFPIDNLPGRNIRISFQPWAIEEYNTRANFRELMMHEMGHQFGLLHSNAVTVNDGEEPGQVHIAGTDDSGTSEDSVMVTDVELAGRWYTDQDRTAMRSLYGTR